MCRCEEVVFFWSAWGGGDSGSVYVDTNIVGRYYQCVLIALSLRNHDGSAAPSGCDNNCEGAWAFFCFIETQT